MTPFSVPVTVGEGCPECPFCGVPGCCTCCPSCRQMTEFLVEVAGSTNGRLPDGTYRVYLPLGNCSCVYEVQYKAPGDPDFGPDLAGFNLWGCPNDATKRWSGLGTVDTFQPEFGVLYEFVPVDDVAAQTFCQTGGTVSATGFSGGGEPATLDFVPTGAVVRCAGCTECVEVMEDVAHPVAGRTSLPLARPDRCEFLLGRTEFRSGCNGMTCRHGCRLDLPAVPGLYCQTCTSYVADPGEPWIG